MAQPRSKPLSERSIREAFRRHLADFFGENYYAVSNSPGPYGDSGRPDMEIVWGGKFYAIEFKAGRYGDHPERGLTELQLATLKKIAKAGGRCTVVNTPPQSYRSEEGEVVWWFEGYTVEP
jgi:hypothetical protein